jgi:hypothetical protein
MGMSSALMTLSQRMRPRSRDLMTLSQCTTCGLHAGVGPERDRQDSVGTLAKTMRDDVYALDAIYRVHERGCCQVAAFA